MLKLFILLFSITIFSACTNLQREETRLQHIEIINEGRIPIMKIDIHGVRYTFLLDSGSPESIIDVEVVLNNKLNIEPEEDLKHTIYGFKKKEYVNLINTRFYVHDLKQTKEKIFYHTNERIDGVIGADALYRNKSVVDFDKEIITHLKLNDY